MMLTLRTAIDRRVIAALVAGGCAAAVRCGDGPTGPTPVVNRPPVIRAVTPTRLQLDSGQELEVTATVEDAETAPNLLRYAWTAQAGAFSGEGPTVRWKAPADGPASEYALTVTVTESYTATGGVPAEHRVTGMSAPVRVNDGKREMRRLAEMFIVDFADTTKSAEYCVRNFTNSCPGKAAELRDISEDRETFSETVSVTYSIADIQLNSSPFTCTAPASLGGRAKCALVIAPIDMVSRYRSTGALERSRGDAWLTGIYENQQWWLCDSNFFARESLLRKLRR